MARHTKLNILNTFSLILNSPSKVISVPGWGIAYI